MALGLRSLNGVGAPPFTKGPYTWDQQVTFLAGIAGANTPGKVYYVDGTNGSDQASGQSWSEAYKTIQAAVTAAGAYGIVYVAPKAMAVGATDPGDYAETVIIPAIHECLAIIGASSNRTQGGLPQIKIGAGSTAMITIRAPGCTIANMGINGASSTGGGILLDDDGSTKVAFGTTIQGCHFKNCKGSTATDSRTGGAIMWAATGGGWQTRIVGNKFYKNVGDIVLKGTSADVPQDVVIEENDFSGPAASVDCNLYLAGGSGMNGVTIKNNVFQQLPAIGSGSVARYIYATGCTGMLVGNYFGCQTNGTGGTRITFKVAGTGAEIPTTMHVAGNFGQTIHATESGEVSIV